VNSSVNVKCCCCDHLTAGGGRPAGAGGPRWRGLNGELTGLLDCSMSLCSHIFRRRSRSFSSCSLVLRSLSSFLSLSSVASISHLQYSVTGQCQQVTKYLQKNNNGVKGGHDFICFFLSGLNSDFVIDYF